jgi:hypothetical protein
VDVFSELRRAIEQRRLVSFSYGGRERIAEPHVLGEKKGEVGLLVFQIGGATSSGTLPNWRRCVVAEIQNLCVLDEAFAGVRSSPSGYHTYFDTVFAVVRAFGIVRG